MFSIRHFSKQLKIWKEDYKSGYFDSYEELELLVQQLRGCSLEALQTDDEKKAFWINAYNGLTNYLIIKLGIQSKMREVPGVFMRFSVNIGGYEWTLDNIEHGLLRRNARQKYFPIPQFMFWDKRKAFMVNELDARIHFALNCGAKSCPSIAFYSAENIEQELAQAEELFVEDGFVVDESKREIQVSKIFAWYKQDFVNQYLSDSRYQGCKIVLMPYDWSI